jgi:hypothetical protein
MVNASARSGGGSSEGGECRTPALLGGVALTFRTPEVSIDGESRTKEHKILDNTTVIQHLGRNAEQITVKGVCTPQEATGLRKTLELDQTKFRSYEWSGEVIVKTVTIDPVLGRDPGLDEWLYDYDVTMVEVSSAAPDRQTYTVTGG